MARIYPKIEDPGTRPARPISFVCVRYSDDFEHNIVKSDCVHDSLNEFIVIENEMNMNFDTLGQAINQGIKRAQNDLVVVVHEDVLLLPGWQSKFEMSLAELEKHDLHWGIAGVVGWKQNRKVVGHWSDPSGYKNTFKVNAFRRVFRVEEQIIILRKSSRILFDSNLPSIHNIGRDLARQAQTKGLKTYVIDAPTIHKYADQNGEVIQTLDDSPKIKDRDSRTHKADRYCSNEYLNNKWNLDKILSRATLDIIDRPDIDSPIILLGKGGSGSRLLSTIAADTGLFIGNKINPSGDCMDMVPAIYRSVIRKYRCPDVEQKKLSVIDLRHAANKMMRSVKPGQKWGFKAPELLLILPELHLAFPDAKFVNFKRKPAGTVLRRSHMTARLDNHIGRIALKAAYQYFSRPVQQLLEDDTLSRMIVTTMHQLAITQHFRTKIAPDHWLEISFEEAIANPKNQLEIMAEYCELPVQSEEIISMVSVARSRPDPDKFSAQDIKRVQEEIMQYSLEQI